MHWWLSVGLLATLAGMLGCSRPAPAPKPTEAQKKQQAEVQAILTAAAASNVEKVKALLQKNPALANVQNDIGETPLTRAAGSLQPSEELVKYLLLQGAEVNPKGRWDTPLQFAAVRGNQNIVSILIDHGANVNARSFRGATALNQAVFTNHTEVAELLIARAAEMDIFDAAALGKTKRLEQLLKNDSKLVNARNPWNWTPLHWAALRGQKEAVKLLMACGADRFAEDNFGRTASSFAREKGFMEIAELLRKPPPK